MDSQRKKKVEALFEAALDRAPEERDAWLAVACDGDEELRAAVCRLLAAHDRGAGILDHRPGELAAAFLDEQSGLQDRLERVGPWRLDREIGRGGMGAVYLAERSDGQFRQTVAVKVLRRGLDTDELVTRFLAERQILATLQHPNIARLLDGGVTTDGRPYLVMEYIDGQSIDVYCDRRRLSVEERLRLFVPVCRAVHYAHRNLVIHRDLKPGNILVTSEGEPKLLDFGIAKLIDPEEAAETAPLTRVGLRLMTPEYASPEQIRGEPVTTAADVYGLGLVLYELLCGRAPYRTTGRSWSEIERMVLDEDPPRPSAVVTRTLDPAGEDEPASVTPREIGRARATEPERLRRALEGDLDRIVAMALRKEPERRYSSAAQLADDIERFLAGQPVLAQGDSPVYRLRKFVLRHRWTVAAVIAFLVLLSGYALTLTVQSRRIRSALDRARIEAQNAARQARRAEQVTAFLTGLFEGSDPRVSPGDPLTARDLLDRGADRAARLGDEPEVQARMFAVIGDVYGKLGEFDRAEEALTRSLEIHRALHGDVHLDVAQGLDLLGELALLRSRYPLADSFFSKALEIKRALLGEQNLAVAESYVNLARAAPPDLDAAQEYFGRALALREALLGADHPQVADILMSQATIARWLHRDREAEATIRRALAIYRKRLDAGDPLIARAMLHLGDQLREQGGPLEEAERLYREALAMPSDGSARSFETRVWSLHSLGHLYAEQGRFDEAEALFHEALSFQERALGPDHPGVATSLENLVSLLLRQDRYAEAEPLQRRALAIWERTMEPRRPAVTTGLTRLTEILTAQGKVDEAERMVREAIEWHRGEYGTEGDAYLLMLAKVEKARRRFGEAERLLMRAKENLEKEWDDSRGPMQMIFSELVDLYEAWGRPDQAAAYRARLVSR